MPIMSSPSVKPEFHSDRVVRCTSSVLDELSSKEKDAFDELRRKFQEKMERTPSDNTLLRFLLLSEFNVDVALKVLPTFYKEWEKFNKASDEQMLREIKTGKWRLGGKDNQGRQIVHFHYHLHHPKQFPIEVTVKTILVVMDMLLEELQVCKDGIVWICWMENSGWSNFDLASEKYFTELFLSFDPIAWGMMSRMVLVNSPWYVWMAMKLMKPFLTKELLERVVFMSTPELVREYSREVLDQDEESLESRVSEGSLLMWS